MQVLNYKAHNVLGIKDVDLAMEGKHLILIGGANGQGKTSALTALVMALAGKSGMEKYPEIPLRDGQRSGKITVELSGDLELHESDTLTAELTWRRKRGGEIDEQFRLLDSTGEEAPEPRTLLKRLFDLRAFDPLAFERLKPKEQATTVQRLLGLDLSKFDEERKQVYEDRTLLGREGKKLAAKLEAMTKHSDAPKEPVNVGELSDKLEKLRTEMRERKTLEDRVAEYEGISNVLTNRIADLESELNTALEARDKSDEAIANAKEQFEATSDHTDAMTELRNEIKNADEINTKYRENQAYKEAEKEVKTSRQEYQAKTDRLSEIDEERAEEVAAAEWPVDGMSLQEDGLLMNDLPFEQASTSQRIMASFRIGMALNPKLRLLVCQQGGDLDLDTLEQLGELAKEHDFQILLELVTRSSEDEERCAVIIEDGEVRE